ncbi:MAG: glycoside hydrolase family 66 protein [Sphaerochaeta sp.]|nr:glycoside hydrolase family 66 protein [Sphaerochaeta sp.]
MGNNLQLRFWPLIPRLASADRSIPFAIEVTGIGSSPDRYSFALRIDRLGHVLITEHWEKYLSTSEASDVVRFEYTISLSSQINPEGQQAGLGIFLSVTDSEGNSAQSKTAIDLGIHTVRYGFLCNFASEDLPSRKACVDFLLQQHCTHVQFYDWSYRPHQYLPESHVTGEGTYHDLMNKPIDSNVVRTSIRTLHDVGIHAIAYGAVYAAPREYLDSHPDQALYDSNQNPIDLIDRFFIMNVAAGNPWRELLLKQYRAAIDTLGFDGIHMDTYGYPKIAFDYAGKRVYLDKEFVSLIDDWAKNKNRNIFNNVGGWPSSLTATCSQEAIYIEVWDPHTEYRHLRQLALEHQRFKKPLIFAAYALSYKPDETPDSSRSLASTCLLMATSCAHGATLLLFGEDGGILTQPYYVDHTVLNPHDRRVLTQYTDFSVQYGELLYGTSLIDITESFATGENREFSFFINEKGRRIPNTRISCDGQPNTLWPIVHMTKTRIVINLLNLLGQDNARWDEGKNPQEKERSVTIQIPIYSQQMRLFTASPEIDDGRAHPLEWQEVTGIRGPSAETTIVLQSFWTLIWAEL